MMQRALVPLNAAAAALGLAGCAVTHVGEDWQCPVAQGVQCASVAAADPAVPSAAALGTTGTAWRTAEADARKRPPASRTSDAAQNDCGPCEEDSNFFEWFAGLFRRDAGGSEDRDHGADAADIADEPQTAEAQDAGAGQTAAVGEVRSPERIGRVWIAPFVDADGVYREGAWVRVVIAPAAWKRP